MNKALIGFSFDDARGDNVIAFDQILVPRGIPATLNVTTGYVDGTASEENLPHNGAPMSIFDINRFGKENGFEIALHGDKHLNTESDIDASYRKIVNWMGLPEGISLGFASPNSGLNVEYFKKSENILFTKKISYLRVSLKVKQKRFLRIFFRKLSTFWRLPAFYKWAYQDTIMRECSDRVMYSVPIMRSNSWKQVACLVDECINRKGALILMFHSISEDFDNWSWSTENFTKLCDHLLILQKQGKIELCTTNYIFEKIKNR